MATTTKGPKKLERHFKGVANHRRVQILLLIAKHPNITLAGIAERLKGNIKTLSEHTRRLALAGLIEKVYEGRDVRHRLSRYGKIFVSFIDAFSNLKPAK
jgi:DNA-binding transcriptional ArsR family regulator